MSPKAMGSPELGLMLAHQLLGMDNLHYGFWDEGLEVTLTNLAVAQRRFADHLLAELPAPGPDRSTRVLDIGCGTGRMLVHLLDRGYAADGVSPAKILNERVRRRLSDYPQVETRLFACRFEELPVTGLEHRYDIALFSESFQFVKIDRALAKLERILKPGGRVVICDVFRTQAEGDGGPGDGVIRGGHSLSKFYRLIGAAPFTRLTDEDITAKVSPTIALLNKLCLERVRPAGMTLGRFLRGNYPKLSWAAGRLFRKRLAAVQDRYFGGHYSRQTFERYKTYRYMVYGRRTEDGGQRTERKGQRAEDGGRRTERKGQRTED